MIPGLGDGKKIIGMIHVQALPGAPKNKEPLERIVASARKEARTYAEAGVDAVAIENMHDIPYLNRNVGPEITAAMTVIGLEVKRVSGLPTGIQILAGANEEALAAALAAELDFVRVEGFVFSHIADEGLMNSDAGSLLRYRKQIGAEHVPIFTDIKKKHSAHALTADVDIVETAKAAEFFLSDGLIVTGSSTGQAVDFEELKKVRDATRLPVLVGSGVTEVNLLDCLTHADGVIVGSWFKKDGDWRNQMDPERVARLVRLRADLG